MPHTPTPFFSDSVSQFIMLTYIFMLAWLGVTAFTSLPVFMYFNIWTVCQNATVTEGANLCLDLRQFGRLCNSHIIPQQLNATSVIMMSQSSFQSLGSVQFMTENVLILFSLK